MASHRQRRSPAGPVAAAGLLLFAAAVGLAALRLCGVWAPGLMAAGLLLLPAMSSLFWALGFAAAVQEPDE